MKSKIVCFALSALVVISMILTSCGTKTTPPTQTTAITTTTTTTTKPTATIPATTVVPTTKPTTATTGNWWNKFGIPQYGSTITIRVKQGATYFDPWYSDRYSGNMEALYMETLCTYDWALDRNLWEYNIGWVPVQYKREGSG